MEMDRIASTSMVIGREFLYPNYDTFSELRRKSLDNLVGHNRHNFPNVKTRVLNWHEKEDILRDLALENNCAIVSDVYALLDQAELHSCMDDPFLVPSNILKKVGKLCHCYIYWRVDETWVKELSLLKGNGCVSGQCRQAEYVCVSAEPISEQCQVTSEGITVIPKVDKRIKLIFPKGSVWKEMPFRVQVCKVNMERYKDYKKRLPKLFTDLTGLSPLFRVCGVASSGLKKRAKVVLPMESCVKDSQDEDDVYMFQWKENEPPVYIGPGNPVYGHPGYYSVDTQHLSSIICIRKKNTSDTKEKDQQVLENNIEGVRYITGCKSICTILTLIKLDPTGSEAILLFDCLDCADKPQALLEKYDENGYDEILHTGLNDLHLENDSKVEVLLEGSFIVYPDHDPEDLEFHIHFNKTRSANALKIPIRVNVGRKCDVKVTFRLNHIDWWYSLQFNADRVQLNTRNIISYMEDGELVQECITNNKQMGTIVRKIKPHGRKSKPSLFPVESNGTDVVPDSSS